MIQKGWGANRLWLVVALSFAALMVPAQTMAGDDDYRFGAWIHQGSVDQFAEDSVGRFGALELEDDPNDIDEFDLSAVQASEFWEGDEYVYLTIDELLAQPHVIVVRAENSLASPVIAIGLIAGEADASGAITVSLQPVDDSGFAGLARVEQDDEDPRETDIDIVVWQGPPVESGTPEAS